MPYKDERKQRDYQRVYKREYMRRVRAGLPTAGLVVTNLLRSAKVKLVTTGAEDNVTTESIANVTTRYNPAQPYSSNKYKNNVTTEWGMQGGESDYSESINVLLSIQGVDNASFPTMNLMNWLSRKNADAVHAIDTAIAMKSAIQYRPKTGTWIYRTASGNNRHYTDLAAVFQKWMSRQTMTEPDLDKKERANVRRARPTVLDGQGWANQYQG